MVFSDTVTYQGIVQETDYLLFGSSTATSPYAIADKTRNVNRHFDDVVSLILQSDARWKWDDDNQIDHPIDLINLVNNQQDYELAGGTYLKVNRVEVKDNNGKYYLIYPIDEKEVQDQAMTEFQGSSAGRPRYYDKIGEYLFLYPKPSSANVTLTSGLKVYYQRLPSYFTATDTTKSPGFAALYHRILSVGAALDYAIANTMTSKVTMLTPMFAGLKSGLIEHYQTRAGDEKVRMTLQRENYGVDETSGYNRISDKAVYW